eukprot:NODE_1231_length_2553_cov_3.617477.p1 GENE.NODE_1231_length_2553_cov_3.617477~~NODE_1231_length_2553_cov_3.617477.p1  ORF type:complete len:707 (-),score=296.28 NODE_1231_length_2553_cov_3.617477:216-2336(-)
MQAAQGFEAALAQNAHLKVDLATTQAAVERLLTDNAAMKEVHADLVAAYKRVQAQHDRARHQLRREQHEWGQLEAEQQEQVALWRDQLEAKAHDFEQLQQQLTAPRELDAIRLQLAEEIEEPYMKRVASLEARLAAEQKRAAEARREAELLKLEGNNKEQDLREQLSVQAQMHRLRETALEQQLTELDAEARRHMDEAAAVACDKSLLQDLNAKVVGLQRALREQEQHSSRQQTEVADELKARIEELSAFRSHSHELQVQLDQEERRGTQLQAKCDELRREHTRMASQLADSQARTSTLRPAEEVTRLKDELAQVRAAAASERDQLNQAVRVAEERRVGPTLELKRAEVKIRQLEAEQLQRDREARTELDESESHSQDKLSSLRSRLEAAEKDASTCQQALRTREAALARQLENASVEGDELRKEQAQLQATHADIQRALRDTRRELREAKAAKQALQQKHEAELARRDMEIDPLRAKIARFEIEAREQAADAEAAHAAMRRQEQLNDALQAEVASLNTRLDSERAQWAREVDDQQGIAVAAQDQRHANAVRQLSEEHRRQTVKLQAAMKRLAQKSAQKRQELRQRCQELSRRVVQLQQERAAAVRLCEENKRTYEMRLLEVGFGAGGGAATPRASLPLVGCVRAELQPTAVPLTGDVVGTSQRELRAIMERLERNTDRTVTPRPAACGFAAATALPPPAVMAAVR